MAKKLFLALFGASVILPLLWVLFTSFKAGPDILASPFAFSKAPHPENYVNAWQEAKVGLYFFNSVVATFGSLAILIPIGAMAAYVLARYKFRGGRGVFYAFIAGMMFPSFLAIVPLFMMISQAGLYDTLGGLVLVYVAWSISFTVFVLYGFFEQVPKELEEAAVIDGCGHNALFWRIMMPLAKPGLLVAAIFDGLGLWNEFNLAKVIAPQNAPTLQVGLANLTSTQFYKSDWGALFAGLVIVMVPVLGVYWLVKERLQEAMLAGAIK